MNKLNNLRMNVGKFSCVVVTFSTSTRRILILSRTIKTTQAYIYVSVSVMISERSIGLLH